jgi:hypothetical protein
MIRRIIADRETTRLGAFCSSSRRWLPPSDELAAIHSITSSAGEHCRWNLQAECPRGLEVDHQLILGRCLHRQVGGLFALENAIGVARHPPELFDSIRAVADQAPGGDEQTIGVGGQSCTADSATRSARVRVRALWGLSDWLPVIDNPNLDDPLENHKRLRLLYIKRGKFMIEIPPDTEWFEVQSLTDNEVDQLYVSARHTTQWDQAGSKLDCVAATV